MVPRRYLWNLYLDSEELLKEVEPLKERLEEALGERYKNHSVYYHQFRPEGVTAFYLLEVGGWPGHLAIHTWPEKKAASLDLVLPEEDGGLMERIKGNLPGSYHDFLKKPRAARELGKEIWGEYKGAVNPFLSEEELLGGLKGISGEAGFTVVGEVSRKGRGYVSGAVVLSESHFSFHYLRELRRGWADIFTCSEEGNPFKAQELLAERLEPVSFLFEGVYR